MLGQFQSESVAAGEQELKKTLGLRDRKRRETSRQLVDVATRLVLEKGYDNVTIDDICAAVDISRRTFFNYFDSKDKAVFGKGIDLSDGLLPDFINGQPQDPLSALVEMLEEAIAEPPSDYRDLDNPLAFHRELSDRRQAIIDAEPHLAQIWLVGFHEQIADMRRAVEEHLTLHPALRRTPQLPIREEAALIVGLARMILTDAIWFGNRAQKPLKSALERIQKFLQASELVIPQEIAS